MTSPHTGVPPAASAPGSAAGVIGPDGARESFTPAVFNDCLRKGAGYTVGYSASVTEQSWRDALAFLDEHLKK